MNIIRLEFVIFELGLPYCYSYRISDGTKSRNEIDIKTE